MPRGRTVQQVPVTDGISNPDIDEVFEGMPVAEQELPEPRTDLHDPIIPSNILDNAMSVTLVNLRYPNEVVFVPQERVNEQGVRTTNNFSPQNFLTFTDGVLVCSETQAEIVMRQCPYVRREPAEGELMVYQPSGFATRNAQTYAEHVARYAEDFQG